jgi:ribosomal protein S18 acetylase RimI-like enzyme
MNISRAERNDLPRILAIQKEAYLSEAAIYDDYSLPPLVQSLEQMIAELETKSFFKAVVDTRVVGSIRASVVEDTCIIERLIVDPRFQRRGIGSALLAHAEFAFPNARRYELFTGSRSMKNIALYEKHGYVRCREEPLSEAVSLVYMQKLGTKP